MPFEAVAGGGAEVADPRPLGVAGELRSRARSAGRAASGRGRGRSGGSRRRSRGSSRRPTLSVAVDTACGQPGRVGHGRSVAGCASDMTEMQVPGFDAVELLGYGVRRRGVAGPRAGHRRARSRSSGCARRRRPGRARPAAPRGGGAGRRRPPARRAAARRRTATATSWCWCSTSAAGGSLARLLATRRRLRAGRGGHDRGAARAGARRRARAGAGARRRDARRTCSSPPTAARCSSDLGVCPPARARGPARSAAPAASSTRRCSPARRPGPASDVHGLAATCLAALTGQPPYDEQGAGVAASRRAPARACATSLEAAWRRTRPTGRPPRRWPSPSSTPRPRSRCAFDRGAVGARRGAVHRPVTGRWSHRRRTRSGWSAGRRGAGGGRVPSPRRGLPVAAAARPRRGRGRVRGGGARPAPRSPASRGPVPTRCPRPARRPCAGVARGRRGRRSAAAAQVATPQPDRLGEHPACARPGSVGGVRRAATRRGCGRSTRPGLRHWLGTGRSWRG